VTRTRPPQRLADAAPCGVIATRARRGQDVKAGAEVGAGGILRLRASHSAAHEIHVIVPVRRCPWPV
jgi:hypothetical protein